MKIQNVPGFEESILHQQYTWCKACEQKRKTKQVQIRESKMYLVCNHCDEVIKEISNVILL